MKEGPRSVGDRDDRRSREPIFAWVCCVLVVGAYVLLLRTPPTNTEAAFDDAARALAGQGPDGGIAYFAAVQDNSLAFSQVIALLRRLGLASFGLPVATLPSLIGIGIAIAVTRRMGTAATTVSLRPSVLLILLSNPLVMFLGTRSWPDALASGLVLIGVAAWHHSDRTAPPRPVVSTLVAVAAVAGCVLKPNLVTVLAATLVVDVLRDAKSVSRRQAQIAAVLAAAVVAIAAWSVLLEAPRLMGAGVGMEEASLLSRIIEYLRIEPLSFVVTLLRYHAYLSLLILPIAITVVTFDSGEASRWQPSPPALGAASLAGISYWFATRGRPTGELDFGRLLSPRLTEMVETVGFALGALLVARFVRSPRAKPAMALWYVLEIVVIMHALVRPTQRYLLPVLLLATAALLATVAPAEPAHDTSTQPRRRGARRALRWAVCTGSLAWSAVGVGFVVSQGRASEALLRDARARGIVDVTDFGPVAVHLGYRASLGDGSCFEVVQDPSPMAGEDRSKDVTVVPMRLAGVLVRTYVLRSVPYAPSSCPRVP